MQSRIRPEGQRVLIFLFDVAQELGVFIAQPCENVRMHDDPDFDSAETFFAENGIESPLNFDTHGDR